jgi:DNA-binding CsgD family transcriptional regulator
MRQLTPRKLEIVRWVALGLSYAQIGLLLGVGEQTIKNAVTASREIMDAETTPHLVAICFREGLIQ